MKTAEKKQGTTTATEKVEKDRKAGDRQQTGENGRADGGQAGESRKIRSGRGSKSRGKIPRSRRSGKEAGYKAGNQVGSKIRGKTRDKKRKKDTGMSELGEELQRKFETEER